MELTGTAEMPALMGYWIIGNPFQPTQESRDHGPCNAETTCTLETLRNFAWHAEANTCILYTVHPQNENREYADLHSLKGETSSRPHQLPIGSQPPESRWSKRAGLHVLHCGCTCSPFVQFDLSTLRSVPRVKAHVVVIQS
jgi:hypothetical protein